MKRRVTPKTAWQFFTVARVALISLIPAACGIAESSRIGTDVNFAEPASGCASALGSYALPKAYLHVVIGQTGQAPPAIQPFGTPAVLVETLRRIDQSLVFCLDYLASALSHDTITIRKWPVASAADPSKPGPSTPFLGAVMVNAADRSVYVIEALIRAAFIAASAKPDFQPRTDTTATPQILADLEYDPFDPDESAAVNERLTKLGYCLVLENYTFHRQSSSVARYCNSPRSYPRLQTVFTKAYLKADATPADKHLPGLLYRPRVPYRLEIYRKINAGGRDPWQLIETQTVNLENMSPVLALDIRRAAFAARTANFLFDSGTLMTACVAKTSEAEGFVDIPLQISRSLVALPGSIISVQIDQVSTQTQLVQAEQQLYQVQKAHLAALAGGTSYQTVSGAPTGQQTPYTLPTPLGLPADFANPAAGSPIAEPTSPQIGTDVFGANIGTLCRGSA